MKLKWSYNIIFENKKIRTEVRIYICINMTSALCNPSEFLSQRP